MFDNMVWRTRVSARNAQDQGWRCVSSGGDMHYGTRRATKKDFVVGTFVAVGVFAILYGIVTFGREVVLMFV